MSERVSTDKAEMANPTVPEPWQRRKRYFVNWRSSHANQNLSPQTVPTNRERPHPWFLRLVVLDPGLDFGFHKDGIIELTRAGFRRMAQAHSAAIDVAIAIDGREVLRFPAQGEDGINAVPENEISDLRAAPGKRCYGHIIGTRFPKL